MRRNLIMHVYPKACHPNWRRAVEHVRQRLDQFDGRRIVSVAYDTLTDTPDMVRDAFGDGEVEIQAIRNGPLQEVESFPGLLEAVSGLDGATFYCHAKGCTHCSPLAASHVWCDVMAEVCLDYPELVDCALSQYEICGAFRSRQPIMGPVSPEWHFAGTWYWFRNAALYARNWQKVDQFWSGIEPYPSQHFQPSEAGCMFHEASVPEMNLYAPRYWKRVVIPSFNRWRKENARYRTTMWPK